MKKITTILMLLMLSMGVWAQSVINIGSGQGKYYNPAGSTVSGGFNAIKFVSNATPTVTLEADADHPSALHSSDGRIGIDAAVTTFTISVPEGYRIKEYQFEAKVVSNGHPAKTFTPEGEEARDIPRDQTWRTYKVENVNAQSTSFTLASSAWSPINSRNFKVTVEEDGVTEEQVAAFEKMGEWLPLIQNQALVTDPSFYTSNALQTNDGQGYAGLLDKNTQTFFHSQYNGTNPNTYHYLQANLSESVNGFYFYTYKRVQNNANRPNEILIQGSNDGENFEDITTVSGDQMVAQNDYLSEKISASTGYQYIRFVVKNTNTGAKFGDYVFFTYSEFWLLPSNETTDAAINLMTTVTSAGSLTPEQIAQINQIDEELRSTTVNVTYIVKDTDGNTLFTSEPQEAGKGQTITSLPVQYQRPLFYTYNDVNVTVNGNMEIEFTATPKEDTPFQPSTSFADAVWYNLTLHSTPHHVTYTADGAQNVTLPTTFTDDETTQWAFFGNPYDGFQIVNKAAGEGLVLGSAKTTGSDNNGGNTYATLQAAGSQVNELWYPEATTATEAFYTGKNGFFLRNAEGHALNKRNGTSNISYWTTGADNGSTFVATKVPTEEEKYQTLIDKLEAYTFGDNLHQYNIEGKTADEADAAISMLKTEGYTPENLAEAQALLAAVKLNLPKANTFLRIKSVNGYVSSTVDPTVTGKYSTYFTTGGSAEEANTIWFFDGTHLMSYATGLYGNNCSADELGVAEPQAYAFVEATDVESKYWIKPSNANYWYGGTPTIDNWGAPVGKNETRFDLEEVTELPITLKEVGGTFYATFSAPVDIASIEGADAFDLEVNADNKTASTKAIAGSGLKAGNGVVLIGTSASATATIGAADEAATTSLKPQYASEPAAAHNEAGHFFLGTKKNSEGTPVIGFYKLKSDGGKTGGFKAYIEKNAAIGEAKEGFDLMFGEATAIETIDNSQSTIDNSTIYNLQGQRVGKAQKGVFIQNGKKVVLK